VYTGTTFYPYTYYPYYPYYPNYLVYSSYYNCYVDPNNPNVCFLYLTYPYPQYGYPNYLYYSQYYGCFVDPNNPNVCYSNLSVTPPNQYAPGPYQTTTTESSYVTQTSYSTETSTLTPSAFAVSTITNIVTTGNGSMDTLYGAFIAALVVLLGVSVFLLLVSKSKTSNPPQTYTGGYRCSNCGNNLKQTDRFCGLCGAQIERTA